MKEPSRNPSQGRPDDAWESIADDILGSHQGFASPPVDDDPLDLEGLDIEPEPELPPTPEPAPAAPSFSLRDLEPESPRASKSSTDDADDVDDGFGAGLLSGFDDDAEEAPP